MNVPQTRSRFALFLATVALAATILGTNLVFLSNLRESTIKSAEADLSRYSLILAQQTDWSFKSLDLVLSSVGDYLARKGVTDSESYRQVMSNHETHLLLKEKITGLPQVDAVTLIDENGRLINFSRYWPIPNVNVSDRDYFIALKADPNLETFVSKPVQNRGSGTWNIYIARRLNDPDGKFMGLILGAISVQFFENFFGATSLATDTAVSLDRRDGVLLAHYPPSKKLGGPSTGAGQRALAAGGNIRELSPEDKMMRIRSARMLPSLPILIVASQKEANVLAGWRSLALLLTGMSLVSTALIFVAAFAISLWWKKQQRLVEVAEAANSAKSAFLATMSHEIRTPMNAVLGLASTLLDQKLDDDQRRTVQSIYDAGDSLLEILNDILEFSRLEAGQLSLESVAFSPETLVDSALSIIEARASAKGLALRSINDPSLPKALQGDAGRLRQILLNLVSNAVKFTAAGEVTVTTRSVANDGRQSTVEWSVTDTGIGIAPEKIGSLFRDFVQADDTINRRFGGSGLGLSICKRLIEQMGGKIEVQSAPGKGSTFRFCLSLELAETAVPVESADMTATLEINSRIEALGRSLRVLVVDDSSTNRTVAVNLLKGFDIHANLACDGSEAVTAVRSFNYDLVLMDMRMPEMDGLQATRVIRTLDGARASIPIIALTANAFAEDIEACRQAGMNDFVVKPVRKKLLIDAIARVLAKTDLLPDPNAAVESPQLSPDAIAQPDPEPAFDSRPFALLVSEIGEETAAEVLAIFVEETDARLLLLRTLASLNDRVKIEREAHSLKGGAATFGLPKIANMAHMIEKNAARITTEEFFDRLALIEDAYRDARNILVPLCRYRKSPLDAVA